MTDALLPPRHADWQDRLAAFIDTRRLQPFAWGTNDCVQFAGDQAEALTGRQPFAAYRGTYSTEHGACRILARGGGLQAMVSECLGAPLASPLLARDGDIGLLDGGAGEMLGVLVGVNWLVIAERGLGVLPLASGLVAWRVG